MNDQADCEHKTSTSLYYQNGLSVEICGWVCNRILIGRIVDGVTVGLRVATTEEAEIVGSDAGFWHGWADSQLSEQTAVALLSLQDGPPQNNHAPKHTPRVIDWHCLYSDSWKGEINPAAFQHPAKFARGLIRRIYAHMVGEGYLTQGDRVLDPFGGVGLGAVEAMRWGMNWTGNELEKRFHVIGAGMDCPGFSKAEWRRWQRRGQRWDKLGLCPDCGDLLDKAGEPMAKAGHRPFARKPLSLFDFQDKTIPCRARHRYEGNLELFAKVHKGGSARLLHGDSRYLTAVVQNADGVISSPPYIDSVNSTGNGIDWGKAGRPDRERESTKRKSAMTTGDMKYGEATGQLGAMTEGQFSAAIGSPPFSGSANMQPVIGQGTRAQIKATGRNAENLMQSSAGNLGAMRADEDGFAAVVGSPPFQSSEKVGDLDFFCKMQATFRPNSGGKHPSSLGTYAPSAENLGAMKSGTLDAVITSPPYGDAVTKNGEGPGGAGTERQRENIANGRGEQNAAKGFFTGYGASDGQLANLPYDGVISSPPFEESNATQGGQQRGGGKRLAEGVDSFALSPDNLGSVKAGDFAAAVSSPPFMGVNGNLRGDEKFFDHPVMKKSHRYSKTATTGVVEYGQTEGQIGNDTGPTFWTAARQIVEECHKLLKPGGVTAWVCKDFVRDGQRAAFSNQWQQLCEACGFELIERARAWVVEETETTNLFAETSKKVVERKSFFRRLAEKKGSPRIDWEDVIFMRKI